MNHWVTIYRFAWVVLGIILAIALTCAFLPKYHIFRELQRKKAELQKENRETEVLTRELRMKHERFNADPAFVERTARNAGMVKDDEIVFKFTNEQSEGVMEAPD